MGYFILDFLFQSSEVCKCAVMGTQNVRHIVALHTNGSLTACANYPCSGYFLFDFCSCFASFVSTNWLVKEIG